MKTTTRKMPATQNQDWGFIGTMEQHAVAGWPQAMKAISKATRQPLESVRIFLDSKHGRHFADYCLGQMYVGKTLAAAIGAAVTQYMTWTIDRDTAHHHGIPHGLPYLTGFVIHCEIEAA